MTDMLKYITKFFKSIMKEIRIYMYNMINFFMGEGRGGGVGVPRYRVAYNCFYKKALESSYKKYDC